MKLCLIWRPDCRAADPPVQVERSHLRVVPVVAGVRLSLHHVVSAVSASAWKRNTNKGIGNHAEPGK